MRQPSPTSGEPPAPAPTPGPAEGAPAPTGTEIVTRPDPGFARGKWEAPAWVFWVMLAIVVLGAAAYLLHRLGILRFGKPNKTDAGAGSPASSRMRRP